VAVPAIGDRVLGKYIKLHPFVQHRAGGFDFSGKKLSGQAVDVFWDFLMTALGLSMIVGGMAFLLSGLIFLLPTGRKQSARDRSFEEARNEIEFYLDQMRKKSE
jgi:hypothetical protein